jgi:hypothetical protein
VKGLEEAHQGLPVPEPAVHAEARRLDPDEEAGQAEELRAGQDGCTCIGVRIGEPGGGAGSSLDRHVHPQH